MLGAVLDQFTWRIRSGDIVSYFFDFVLLENVGLQPEWERRSKGLLSFFSKEIRGLS